MIDYDYKYPLKSHINTKPIYTMKQIAAIQNKINKWTLNVITSGNINNPYKIEHANSGNPYYYDEFDLSDLSKEERTLARRIFSKFKEKESKVLKLYFNTEEYVFVNKILDNLMYCHDELSKLNRVYIANTLYRYDEFEKFQLGLDSRDHIIRMDFRGNYPTINTELIAAAMHLTILSKPTNLSGKLVTIICEKEREKIIKKIADDLVKDYDFSVFMLVLKSTTK